MGGKKKRKTTQTYRPAGYVEGGARQAVNLARQIGSQEYEAYGGPRVAQLSQNEQAGLDLARDSVGVGTPYYEESAGLARDATRSFTDAGVAEQYMSPYIESALDPTARRFREEGARQLNELRARGASTSAFGGSRAALMEAEAARGIREGVGDIYAEGMQRAYESAANLFGRERAMEMQASGRIQSLGDAYRSAATQDISNLMITGATDRNIQQAMMDFDYSQFVEGRDWNIRNLGALISGLQGVQGSTTTTQTSETEEKGGELAQALGLGATLLGAFYGGPASAMGGLAGKIGGGGLPQTPPSPGNWNYDTVFGPNAGSGIGSVILE